MSHGTHDQKGQDKGLLDLSHHSQFQPAQTLSQKPLPHPKPMALGWVEPQSSAGPVGPAPSPDRCQGDNRMVLPRALERGSPPRAGHAERQHCLLCGPAELMRAQDQGQGGRPGQPHPEETRVPELRVPPSGPGDTPPSGTRLCSQRPALLRAQDATSPGPLPGRALPPPRHCPPYRLPSPRRGPSQTSRADRHSCHRSPPSIGSCRALRALRTPGLPRGRPQQDPRGHGEGLAVDSALAGAPPGVLSLVGEPRARRRDTAGRRGAAPCRPEGAQRCVNKPRVHVSA